MTRATRPQLPDAEAALAALAERMRGAVAFDAAFVGIYSGGAWLAERLRAMVPGNHPVGFIDVSFYRDDYAARGPRRAAPSARELPFDVDGATIVLVDDVLYTGRSVRAAINELFDFGRPDAHRARRAGRPRRPRAARSSRRTAARGSPWRATCRSCCRATAARLRSASRSRRRLSGDAQSAAQRQRRAHASAHARGPAART